ncbi:MAG: hypothetical protein LWY06_16385 [Firmicutes bacterium]|nr:hypothetical protein [Bacillota bacterium]
MTGLHHSLEVRRRVTYENSIIFGKLESYRQNYTFSIAECSGIIKVIAGKNSSEFSEGGSLMVLLPADACGFFFFIFMLIIIVSVVSSVFKSAQNVGGSQGATDLSNALNELKQEQAKKATGTTYSTPYSYPQAEVKRPPINWNMIRLNMSKEQINECFDMQALAKGVKKDDLYKYVKIDKLRSLFPDVQLRDMVDMDFFEKRLKEIAMTAVAGTATYGAVKSVIDKMPKTDSGGVPYTSLKQRAVDTIRNTVEENYKEIKDTARKDIRQAAPLIADKYNKAKTAATNTVRDVTQALEQDNSGMSEAYQGLQEYKKDTAWELQKAQEGLNREVEAAKQEAERIKRAAKMEAEKLKAAALQDANRLKQTAHEDTNKFLQKAASMAVSGAAVKAVADITGKVQKTAEKASPYTAALGTAAGTIASAVTTQIQEQPVRAQASGIKPLPIPGVMGSVKKNLEAIHNAISWKEINAEPAFMKPYEKYAALAGEFSEDD